MATLAEHESIEVRLELVNVAKDASLNGELSAHDLNQQDRCTEVDARVAPCDQAVGRLEVVLRIERRCPRADNGRSQRTKRILCQRFNHVGVSQCPKMARSFVSLFQRVVDKPVETGRASSPEECLVENQDAVLCDDDRTALERQEVELRKRVAQRCLNFLKVTRKVAQDSLSPVRRRLWVHLSVDQEGLARLPCPDVCHKCEPDRQIVLGFKPGNAHEDV